MFRVAVLFTGMAASFAPALLAQNQTVCIFQQKQGRVEAVDAGFDSNLLAKELATQLPAGLNIVPVTGFIAKEIDAEARHRNCNWVVVLTREHMAPSTPNYGGTLGNTQQATGFGSQLWIKGTKLGGDTLLEYVLRKGDDRKTVSHGEGEDDSTYGKFAQAIAKKIQKEK